jgi:hypothetical protein
MTHRLSIVICIAAGGLALQCGGTVLRGEGSDSTLGGASGLSSTPAVTLE